MPEKADKRKPIDVVLDTSILREDPQRRSASFKALDELCKKRLARVHLPDVVCREFKTNAADEQREALQQVVSKLKRFGRRSLPAEAKEAVSMATGVFEKKAKVILQEPQASFDDWCGRIGAKVHKSKPGHLAKVLDSYFDGAPPFKKVKSREDFPDACIYEVIKDLAQELEKLNVVIHDKNLAKACKGIGNVKVYMQLEDFITSPECHALLRDKAFEEHLPRVCEVLQKREEVLEAAVESEIVDALARESFEDDSIPTDDNTATILTVDEPTELEFECSDAVYIGAGIINVPFSCVVEVQVYYYIYKSDYHLLPRDRAKRISVSEYDNRHYYDAEETLEVKVEGVVSVEFDLTDLKTPLTKVKLEESLENASIKIDSITSITPEPREYTEDDGDETEEEAEDDTVEEE